jgi:hypothetical protein
MTLSTFLDVAISLVFVFFTISMFVSGIVEMINAFWEQRSKFRQLALLKILEQAEDSKTYNQLLLDVEKGKEKVAGVFAKFWNHPLLQVKRHRLFGSDKPISYLSGDSFSTIIIDLLAPSSAPPTTDEKQKEALFATLRAVITNPAASPELAQLKKFVTPLLNRSDSLNEFKVNLERWYDGYMEQVSGWYKRYTQGLVWIVATVVTIALNVDTIRITQNLFNDKDLRENLVAQAEQTAQQQTRFTAPDSSLVNADTSATATNVRGDKLFMAQLKTNDSTLHTSLMSGNALTGLDSLEVRVAYVRYLQSRIEMLQLPIGWTFPVEATIWQKIIKIFTTLFTLTGVGWLLTIAALSFGAPFWFDVLVKLVNIRNTTRKPLSSAVPDSK